MNPVSEETMIEGDQEHSTRVRVLKSKGLRPSHSDVRAFRVPGPETFEAFSLRAYLSMSADQ